MPLRDYPIDIEIDGKKAENRIIEPSIILRDLPDMRVIFGREIFDHLLGQIREDNIMVFPFKATAQGLTIESEARIQVLGLDIEKGEYYAVFSLL